MYQVTRSPSGLTIATAEMPHMASISLGLWVGVGSRYEPTSLNGVCHFIEHMLFKGTRRRSALEISQAIEGLGGYLNAFTSEENTCFYSKARQGSLRELLDVLTDMFLESRFAPIDIGRERRVIKEEVSMYLDQPHHHVQELLNEILWPGHPLGYPITGTEETVDRIRRADLLRFMRSYYVAPCTFLVAAGRVRHRQLLQAIKPFLSRFPSGDPPVFTPATSHQTKPIIRLITKEIEQTQLALGIRTCSRQDPRRFALRLLNTILGENMSSRLFQQIREDRGLAYSIYSSPSFFADSGDLVISAGLETRNLLQVTRLVVQELNRLANALVPRAEFQRARDYLVGQLDLSLEGTESQMMWVGEQLVGYGDLRSPAAVKRQLSMLTPSHVRRVARDFFRPERLNLALVSPRTSTVGLPRILAATGARSPGNP